jgi:hypothetical protein
MLYPAGLGNNHRLALLRVTGARAALVEAAEQPVGLQPF